MRGIFAIGLGASLSVIGSAQSPPALGQERAIASQVPSQRERQMSLSQGQTENSHPSLKVAYRRGLLTINATNSTLADILSAIRIQSGAAIELPPGGAQDRVFTHIGPSPIRDAIAALLNGSGFNYLIVGSTSDPSAIEKLTLMRRGSLSVAAAVQPPSVPQLQIEPGETPVLYNSTFRPEPDAAPEAGRAEPAETAIQPSSPVPSTQPGMTPGQILDQMQKLRIQLRQQQQQQQQVPAPPQ